MLHYVIQQWKYLQTGRFIDLNFTLSSLKSLFAKARSRYLTFQWDCFSTCYNNAAFLFNVFFKLSTELVALSLSKRYQIIGSACEGRHTEGLIAFIMQWAVCCHPTAAAFAPTGPVPLSFAKQELPPGFHCLNSHSFFFYFSTFVRVHPYSLLESFWSPRELLFTQKSFSCHACGQPESHMSLCNLWATPGGARTISGTLQVQWITLDLIFPSALGNFQAICCCSPSFLCFYFLWNVSTTSPHLSTQIRE